MRLPLFIARRYLFAKKKQGAINIISLISVLGVAVGSAALIVILSVFNGIDSLLEKNNDAYSPQLVIIPETGKFMYIDTISDLLRRNEAIIHISPIIEEKALLRYYDQLIPVIVKGVDSNYLIESSIQKHLIQSSTQFPLATDNQSIIGGGIASSLKIAPEVLTQIELFYPNKEKRGIESPIISRKFYPVATFSCGQELDNQYLFIRTEAAEQLFQTKGKYSKIELRTNANCDIASLKYQLTEILGSHYRVLDKYDLNRSFYAMMQSEKLAIFLILIFILFIASFNIVGSISMLILDKKEDLATYKAIGMTTSQLIRIFSIEGNLITWFGAGIGIAIGTLLTLLQEHFGFITLGDGSYIVHAYPVRLLLSDVLIIFFSVICIGYIAAYFPVRYLIRKLVIS